MRPGIHADISEGPVRTVVRYRALLIALLIGTVSSAVSQQRSPTAELPKDQQASYRIGVARFQGVSLQPEREYLTSSVPQLLFERLQRVPGRMLSAAERAGLRRNLLDTATAARAASLASLQNQRDELLFSSADPARIATDRASLSRQIEESRAALMSLREADPSVIPVADEKPLEFKRGSEGPLLEPPEGSLTEALESYARKQGLDALIYGTVEEIQGYLFFEVVIWSALSRQTVYAYQDAVEPQEVSLLLETLSAETADAVLGRPWGILSVEVMPRDAAVYLDGNLAGLGSTEIRYLKPGEHRVTVRAEGYAAQDATVTIREGETGRIEFSLAETPKEITTVLSEPPGANVYVGSLFRGITPLTIETPDRITQLLIRMQGYRDLQHIISPADSRTLSFTLEPLADPAPQFLSAKDDFYAALGYFVLSVPVTVGAFAMYQNRAAADASVSTRARLANPFLYAYYGGFAISAGLLVNTVIKLFRYIDAGESTY